MKLRLPRWILGSRMRGLRGYVFTVAMLAGTAALRALLEPVLGDRVPFTLFQLAAIAAAWFGGLGPGLLALAAGFLIAPWFGASKSLPFGMRGMPDLIGATSYFASGGLLVVFSAALQAVGSRLLRSAEVHRQREVQLREEVAERQRTEKALRLSEERLRVALEGSPIIVFSQDRDLRYTWIYNAPPEYEVERILGKTDAEIFERREDAEALGRFKHEVMRTGASMRREVRGRPLGVDRVYDFYIEPRRDAEGEICGVTCVATEVTDRKRAEEAIAEADRRKTEFLAMLGHELRNPLAAIRYAVRLLEEARLPDARSEHVREVISRQIVHLQRLIDDLLDITRITLGKILIHRERVDLVDIVRSIVDDHRGVIESAGVELCVESPDESIWIDGDAVRISQAVGNLLHNSEKFTERGGRIRVSVGRVDGGPYAEVRVSDTGHGIAPEALPKLFRDFGYTDAEVDRRNRGLGLGLPLVKRLVELHGGEVLAASAGRGKGSEFVIRLPALS